MQSYLDAQRRPVIPFDPTNPEHRRHVSNFIKKGTWADCPIAFYAPDNLSVKAYALETLVEFYLKQEFASKSRRGIRSGKLISIKANAS